MSGKEDTPCLLQDERHAHATHLWILSKPALILMHAGPHNWRKHQATTGLHCMHFFLPVLFYLLPIHHQFSPAAAAARGILFLFFFLEKRMAVVLLSGQQLSWCSCAAPRPRAADWGSPGGGCAARHRPAGRPAAPEPEATGVDLDTPPHRTPAVQVVGSMYRPPGIRPLLQHSHSTRRSGEMHTHI
jgi:hypothetical protein